MKKLFIFLLMVLWAMPAFAQNTNFCNDANNIGCFLMEDSGTESDRGGNTSNDVTVSAGDTIPLNTTDKKFGSSSREFGGWPDREWMEHNDGLETDLSGTSVSMVAWVKLDDYGDEHAVVAKWDQGVGQSYMMRVDKNGVLGCNINTDGVASTTSSAVPLTTWTHVACVYNGTDIRAYVDGTLISNGSSNPDAYTSSIDNVAQEFVIGARHSFGTDSDQLDGLVDDVAIFSDALTTSEITEIVTYGLVGSGGGGGGGPAQGDRERWIIVD